MKICLLTRFFNFSNGGIGVYSTELLRELLERGHELDLLNTTWGGTAGYFLYTALELKLKIPKDCDLYHACTPVETIHLPKNKPRIVTFHDLIPWLYHKQIKTWYFGGKFGKIRRWIGHSYFKFAAKRAMRCDTIIANSKQTRDDLLSVGADESKIQVVRLGIPSDMKLGRRDHSGKYTVGTLSYLDPRKRIHLLIEAFRKTDIDGRLLIAGKGMDKKRLEAIAGGDKRITFLGFVPPGKLADFYRSLDVFVLPTQFEGYCMPPWTNVFTWDGLKPISKVRKGEKVLTSKGDFKKVTKIFNRNFDGKLIKITPWSFNEAIELTLEHPVRAFKRPKNKWAFCKKKPWEKEAPKWISSKNLEKGDCVVFPIPKPIPLNLKAFDLKEVDSNLLCTKNCVMYKMGYSPKGGRVRIKRFIPFNEKLARLLGYYVAEGSVNRANSSDVEFSLGVEPTLAVEITNLLKELFGVESVIRKSTTKMNVLCYSKIIGRFLSSLCGIGTKNKRIPREFLYGPKKFLQELVECERLGDGTRVGNEDGFSTSSRQLANDLKLALLRLGHKPRIMRHKREDGREEFTVTFSQNNDKNYSHSNKSWFLRDGIALLIRKVEQVDYSGPVYNLEVAEDNSYTVESFAVHNCMPIVESLACGTPVITLSDAIIPWDVREHTKPVAVEELPSALQNPPKIRNKSIKFAQSHDWGKMVDAHVKIYDEVVG